MSWLMRSPSQQPSHQGTLPVMWVKVLGDCLFQKKSDTCLLGYTYTINGAQTLHKIVFWKPATISALWFFFQMTPCSSISLAVAFSPDSWWKLPSQTHFPDSSYLFQWEHGMDDSNMLNSDDCITIALKGMENVTYLEIFHKPIRTPASFRI